MLLRQGHTHTTVEYHLEQLQELETRLAGAEYPLIDLKCEWQEVKHFIEPESVTKAEDPAGIQPEGETVMVNEHKRSMTLGADGLRIELEDSFFSALMIYVFGVSCSSFL